MKCLTNHKSGAEEKTQNETKQKGSINSLPLKVMEMSIIMYTNQTQLRWHTSHSNLMQMICQFVRLFFMLLSHSTFQNIQQFRCQTNVVADFLFVKDEPFLWAYEFRWDLSLKNGTQTFYWFKVNSVGSIPRLLLTNAVRALNAYWFFVRVYSTRLSYRAF